ncbi:M1 family metallopeptidase [Edaphobacter sp.]|uniref:M1 family metallopeptidase n=1 Tax=Edaphobacter sp. TaxID=1934404 RepID=UPI002DB890B7|nr:M1 family metallopeptidase [Edaphobacter sp.]HEU5342614.1 M1 family metallopeptidase [Edaphobacter sp.]
MKKQQFLGLLAGALVLGVVISVPATGQGSPAAAPPTYDVLLRGGYGPYRANNDLLYYHLDIRVDPVKQFVSGKNTIRFKMLADGTRIQLELYPTMQIDRILLGRTELKYERDGRTVLVDFPKTLHKGRTYSIDFYYSGQPKAQGRFGCFTFKKDTAGTPWITTACEGTGPDIWWPNKEQWRDEVRSMRISVAVPNGLMDVSNGKFDGSKDLGDGYTQWNWHVHYPINNYDVALNIANYQHFSDRYKKLHLDFYALPEDLAKAKTQFTQAKGMLEAFTHYFGPYPFPKDGYKLIEVPYSGMEHQSAVSYGNLFKNGYLGRDWTGVGISPRFDFIIIHESGHEWFGNSITAADKSDMWIHEGWTTYLEGLYVEYRWGKADALKYLNAYKSKIANKEPIIPARGINAEPPEDQYFKSALMLNTLRSIVDDDARWFRLIHDFYQHFKYQNIMTEDVVAWFNQQTGMNLTPVFDQYLRHTAIPVLELKFNAADGTVAYRWKAGEQDFAMPVRVGEKDHWLLIHPTTVWQTMKTPLTEEQFGVATDLYYVDVSKS